MPKKAARPRGDSRSAKQIPALLSPTPKGSLPRNNMETVKRQNLSEVIAGRIKHFIITNQLKPGDRLPTEHEMAPQFGVSRVSVREATKAWFPRCS